VLNRDDVAIAVIVGGKSRSFSRKSRGVYTAAGLKKRVNYSRDFFFLFIFIYIYTHTCKIAINKRTKVLL